MNPQLRALLHPGRGWSALKVIAQHRPAARHEVIFVRIVQGPPAVALVHEPVTGGLVLPEPGPPALPVLLVPFGSLAVNLGGTGRLSDVVQGDSAAAPADAATLGEPVLG